MQLKTRMDKLHEAYGEAELQKMAEDIAQASDEDIAHYQTLMHQARAWLAEVERLIESHRVRMVEREREAIATRQHQPTG